MSENPASIEWSASRGEKWRSHLSQMESMLAPVDEPLLEALELDRARRIVDVGCGGGGTTLEIRRRATAADVVHGFDISPALVETAQARAQGAERAVRFELADVAATSPPDVPYDRLTSRFGIMFYDDPSAAFRNLSRWLAPGGRFAFAVWGPPKDNPWMASLRQVVAELVDLPAPDPEAPGPFRYAGAQKLLNLLEGAGLDTLEVRDWRGELPIGGGLSAPEAAHFALTSFSVGEPLDRAGEATRQKARRSLTAHFSRHQRDGAVWMDARVHLVTGARPG